MPCRQCAITRVAIGWMAQCSELTKAASIRLGQGSIAGMVGRDDRM